MRNTGMAALALIGAAGSVHAQIEGTGTWLWEVTTQNGDAIVEPGETASITLSALMQPDMEVDFLIFAAAVFNVLGQSNADNGHIAGWEIHNGLADLKGDRTTTDGVSLFNILAGQILPPFVTDNPIDVITFEWAPDRLGQYNVAYMTTTETFRVWAGDDFMHNDDYEWPVAEANISFSVVPAPGLLCPAAMAAALLVTRRRTILTHP